MEQDAALYGAWVYSAVIQSPFGLSVLPMESTIAYGWLGHYSSEYDSITPGGGDDNSDTPKKGG